MPATYSESMTDRTNFTKAMLERMMALKREGKTSREILASMQAEYGAPRYVSEVNSELHFLSQGKFPSLPPPSNHVSYLRTTSKIRWR